MGTDLGENIRMEDLIGPKLTPEDRAAFTEFKRTRREQEVRNVLKRLLADASRRETDNALLKKICDYAKRSELSGVLVSPVHVSAARRHLAESGVRVICIVGGNGETLPAVKKYEAKRALKAGAGEIRLIPCYPALIGNDLSYLKRELRKVRRVAKNRGVVLSLEDHSLGEREIALGTRAAAEGGATGVCVRGETELVLRAVGCAAGKLSVDCSGVENADQLRSLISLGAVRLVSPCPESISEQLFSALDASVFAEGNFPSD